jgi:hypothetical protein
MARTLRTLVVALSAALALAGTAQAQGGGYAVVGGSEAAAAQVRAALDASAFDWSVLPAQVTIEITRCGCAGAQPGTIVLDEETLTSSPFGPRYAWGIVQHELAHQLDFLLFARRERRILRRQLGGSAWCHEQAGVAHDANVCERFATAVAWAFWPSRENVQRPAWRAPRPLRARSFRRLATRLVAHAAARARAAQAVVVTAPTGR